MVAADVVVCMAGRITSPNEIRKDIRVFNTQRQGEREGEGVTVVQLLEQQPVGYPGCLLCRVQPQAVQIGKLQLSNWATGQLVTSKAVRRVGHKGGKSANIGPPSLAPLLSLQEVATQFEAL